MGGLDFQHWLVFRLSLLVALGTLITRTDAATDADQTCDAPAEMNRRGQPDVLAASHGNCCGGDARCMGWCDTRHIGATSLECWMG
eukprot:1750898-Rhodomonas_salina.1